MDQQKHTKHTKQSDLPSSPSLIRRRITRLTDAQFKSAYGILCSSPISVSGNSRDGLSPTFCRILPQGQTTAHAHFECEIFFIISGHGRMTISDESAEVNAGDLIRIPSSARHSLVNTGTDDLVFLSVYSEDIEVPPSSRQVVITAAPPTPNGPLHLGHLSGPYLAADILARALRQRVGRVVTHSGTDDHQNYVSEVSRNEMRERIKAGLDRLDISFDEFIEPKTDLAYQKKILHFAHRALQAGVIVPRRLRLPHCANCDHFLVDAWIDGNCPSCENPSRGGCESCGLVVPPQDLLHPRCTRCHSHAQMNDADVHVFDLGKHLPLITEDLARLNLPPRLRDLVTHIARRPNLEILVTHPDRDGSGIRLPETTNLSLHVWFEMAAHYERFAVPDPLDAPKPSVPSEPSDSLDPSDSSDPTWIHCFGFDNAFHYLLFIPALLRALNPRAKLPDAVVTNEFLLLEGRKFSTSQCHAIWADEFDADPEHLRFYLSLQRPDTRMSDFIISDFRSFSSSFKSQLTELNALATTAVDDHAGPTSTLDASRLTREIAFFLSPNSFDLRRAARRLLEFIDLILQNRDSDQRPRLRALATALEPIMPQTSHRLRNALGLEAAP